MWTFELLRIRQNLPLQRIIAFVSHVLLFFCQYTMNKDMFQF